MDNTLIIFLSDNGACAEDIPEGVTAKELVDPALMIAQAKTRDGKPVRFGNDLDLDARRRGHLSELRHRLGQPLQTPRSASTSTGSTKAASRRPFIVHWPRGISEKGGHRHNPSQLTDVMATILDVTGATYPKEDNGNAILPCEGESLVPLSHRPMAAAVRCSGSTRAMRPYASASGSWCGSSQARGSSTIWRPTGPRCMTLPNSIPCA